MNKYIIALIVFLSALLGTPKILAKTKMENEHSSLTYDLNGQNLILVMKNKNNPIEALMMVGQKKDMEPLKLMRQGSMWMGTIPENTKEIEIRNPSTREFFTIKVN